MLSGVIHVVGSGSETRVVRCEKRKKWCITIRAMLFRILVPNKIRCDIGCVLLCILVCKHVHCPWPLATFR
jgi:hypothetical protein